MATRQQTKHQLHELESLLRESLRGGMLPGEAMPTVRSLAQQFGVSTYIAHQALQNLRAEGLLRVEKNVGGFRGAPRSSHREVFVFARSARTDSSEREGWVRRGFERRIAVLGGSVAIVDLDEHENLDLGGLPRVSGVLEFPTWVANDLGCARVRLVEAEHAAHYASQNRDIVDSVFFDNERGGAQATGHLLEEGHKIIAFLGIHYGDASEIFDWSLRRARGWQTRMSEAGHATQNLLFLPQNPPKNLEKNGINHNEIVIQQARDAAQALCDCLEKEAISGVVCANDLAAFTLLRVLKERRISCDKWPSLVGFDHEYGGNDELLTSLELPWDELGALAATLLFERAHGKLPPEPQHRSLTPILISRLSCRPNWPQFSPRVVKSRRGPKARSVAF